jgi:hypothetical protein
MKQPLLVVGIILLVIAIILGIYSVGFVEIPEEAKDCVNDEDCVVFGETGDCNCGCFNKDYQWESDGECFCAAPTSCKCVNGRCEGVFGELEQVCINSGGTVRASLCCLSTDDFPNLCLIGPCGCSPENSHEVKICDCGEGKCWDSERKDCVSFPVD